jgi:hypothetical protein
VRGGFGGGGFRGGRFDINKPHGSLYYTAGASALNASPFSLTGIPSTNPGYFQQRFGANLGGPLNIPKIYNGGTRTFFFLNYNGALANNPYDAFSTVPTLAERGCAVTSGTCDFSQTTITTHDSSGNPVSVPIANMAAVPRNLFIASPFKVWTWFCFEVTWFGRNFVWT